MIENWMEYCAKRGLVCQVNNSDHLLGRRIKCISNLKRWHGEEVQMRMWCLIRFGGLFRPK